MDDAAAPFLFSEGEVGVEKVGSPHVTGVSTGERLLRDRPDLYQSIVYLLGQGTGIREIKRITNVHHRTIEAVMMREGQTIDTARKELGARALRVAAMGVERLEEIIADGDIKPGELSMAVGILTDKAQLLTGGVTSRVEKVESAQVAAGLQAFLDALPVAEAQEVPAINLGAENSGAIAHDHIDPDAWITEAVTAAVPGQPDEQSGVLTASDSGMGRPVTNSDTNRPLKPAPDHRGLTPGGEGVDAAPNPQNPD